MECSRGLTILVKFYILNSTILQVAKLLLDKRSQVNVESESNKDSPLTFACWKGHEGVSKIGRVTYFIYIILGAPLVWRYSSFVMS